MSLRQTKLSRLRSLHRKLSEGVRGGGGRWSAAHASGAGSAKLVILDTGSQPANVILGANVSLQS